MGLYHETILKFEITLRKGFFAGLSLYLNDNIKSIYLHMCINIFDFLMNCEISKKIGPSPYKYWYKVAY